MQVSLSMRGFTEYAVDYHMQIKTLVCMVKFHKDFQNTAVTVLYSFMVKVREISVNYSRTCCDDTKKHSNSAVEYGKEQ